MSLNKNCYEFTLQWIWVCRTTLNLARWDGRICISIRRYNEATSLYNYSYAHHALLLCTAQPQISIAVFRTHGNYAKWKCSRPIAILNANFPITSHYFPLGLPHGHGACCYGPFADTLLLPRCTLQTLIGPRIEQRWRITTHFLKTAAIIDYCDGEDRALTWTYFANACF